MDTPVLQQPKQLSVQLVMTPELSGELQREAGSLDVARAYIVTTANDAQLANTELKSIKERIRRVTEAKAGFVMPAKQIIANAEAFFDPALRALEESERYLKGELTRFTAEQQRLADEARRKQENEIRAARQKAEAEAAAARAKAEQEAKELTRQAREAEEAQKKAEAEGNAKQAAKLAAEAAKREEESRIAREAGERRAAQLELAGAATAPTTIAHEPVKLEGFSTRDNWKCELAEDVTEEQARDSIVAEISGVPVAQFKRRDLLPLIARDPKACGQYAKALKKSMNVPGLVAVNRPAAASRAG